MKPIYDFTVIRKRLCDQTPRVLDAPGEVARICAGLEHYDREHLVALYLDARLQLIGRETVHIGTADTCVISPREIFRGGLLAGATQLILVHNHPSGNPTPSDEDHAIANLLERSGKLIGIPMADFVVVGDGGRYWSRTHGQGQITNDPTNIQAEVAGNLRAA